MDKPSLRPQRHVTTTVIEDETTSGGPFEVCLMGLAGSVLAHRFVLAQELVHMGRDESVCEIPLVDRGVSRCHASIRRAPVGFVVEDLDSTNGVTVNGDKIQRRVLQHGDQIGVGMAVFKFLKIADVETRHIEGLMQAVTTDDLTGLCNRRHFNGTLHKAIAAATRNNQPLSLVMFDIDHFKRLNDTHGHLVGDQVLRHIATAAQRSVRDIDTTARYGGEEFAVIVPQAELLEAAVTAERIRLAIEALSIDCDGIIMRCTASFGVADLTDATAAAPPGSEHETVQDVAQRLINCADTKLYESKDLGRNRVTH